MLACLKWMQLINHTLDGVISPSEYLKSKKRITRQHVFSSLPSPLLVISYIFYFNGLMCGPICSFEEFYNLVGNDPSKKNEKLTSRISHTKRLVYKGFKKLFVSLCWLSVFLVLSPFFSIDKYFNDGYWIEWNWIFRILYLHVVLIVWRSLLYFAWLAAEGAIIWSGLVLGRHDKPSIEFSNANIYNIELGLQDLRSMVHNWNISVQEWLYHDVYIRMMDISGSKWSRFGHVYVFFISAWWHGIYPGYFVTLVSYALAMNAEAKLLKLFKYDSAKESSIAIQTMRRILMRIVFVYITTTHLALTWDRTILLLGSFYYIGHIMILLVIALL